MICQISIFRMYFSSLFRVKFFCPRYDSAANRLNFNTSRFGHVTDNRLKQWRDQVYSYDAWGNLTEKSSGLAKWQTFTYDCENRLVKAETLVNSKLESTGTYQ
ncbi:hypothetical protein PSFL111601_19315 [Pseudomonas floridensis]